MDPDKARASIVELARRIAQGEGLDGAEELAELVLALDEWLRKGGFLPESWNRTARDSS